MEMKVLVTGGAGFIGSHFVRKLLSVEAVQKVLVLDNLTYAGRMENLFEFEKDPRFSFVKGDIRDAKIVDELIKDANFVVNFAAESHVDRSIADSSNFISTNIVGTHTLLEAVKKRTDIRYLQVSTDEVYGSIPIGHWTEDSPLLPNSPYSASKASADLLVRAFNVTYGVDTVITRCSNNFGSHQFPEKLIPLSIIKLMKGKKIQIYGNGLNIRDWLHVTDHCEGIYLALIKGESGSVYNIGADAEKTNLEISDFILNQMGFNQSSVEFVGDRLGHDLRYAVSFEKARSDLGFEPKVPFESGMKETIDWYVKNEAWWKDLVSP
jgi:dTDP-glucose 4,6-dehydratase